MQIGAKTKLFLGTALAMVGGILLSRSTPVSAHTATITTSNSITLDVSPVGNGTSIHEESINVTTTCRAGYNLSIATPEGSNLYQYTNGTASSTASFTAVNGSSALDSANNTNKWGYTLTANATGSTVFSPLSATSTPLKTTSQTASPSSDIDDTFSIYYGIKTDNTVAPGNYQMANHGAIVYYLTMDDTCNTIDIAYDGNNADAGTMGAAGTGVIHTGVKDGDTVSLIASNFSRSGYGFAGWSVDPNAGTKLIDNDNTNNPVVYGPQEDVTLPVGFTNYDTDNDGIVKLYAVWIQSQGNLQGWMGCSNLDTTTYDSTTGALDITKKSITALTDQRDNDTYAIARLADGECWMIENLRLDNTAQLTIYNTNNPLNDGTNVTLKHNYSDTTTYDTLSAPGNWCSATSDSCVLQSRLIADNTANRAINPTTDTDTNIYSYGNYYNWYSATAGRGNFGYAYLDTDAVGDLCPTGWRLPQGGPKTKIESDENDYWNLIVGRINGGVVPANYNSLSDGGYYGTTNEARLVIAKIKSFPNNFLYSGFVLDSVGHRSAYGDYWTSTYGSNRYDEIYGLYFQTTVSLSPGNLDTNIVTGRSIRCMASNPTTYTLSYNANGGSGAPASQTLNANGFATFTISSVAPTRSGYTFAGWMDEDGNGVQPGGTYRTKSTNATLYAIWTNNSCNPTATTIGTGNSTTDAVCLQDVKPGMKSSLPTADASSGTYTLIDARDGQSYTVAKLPDGELWLTKNLNYGSNSDILLTPYDTDLPTGTTFKAPASTTDFETTNSSNTYISPKILTDSTYGGYYSYATAIASTNAYSSSNQNITTSICPKSWDLPTSAQYTNLKSAGSLTSYTTSLAAPYSFVYAGYRNGTSFTSQSNSIRMWTSTNYSSSYAYYTTVYQSPSYSSNYKRYGESVRCIASNGTVTINYDGNGTSEYPATGTTASQTNVEINSTNAMANGFTRTNWTFNGWNTAADGSGTSIAAGASLNNLNLQPNSIITLYAQWLPQYTITYVNNCMTYASANEFCDQTTSDTTSKQIINLDASGNGSGTLAAYNKWTLTGWKIAGWSTVADNTTNNNTEHRVGSTYLIEGQNVSSNITLYAHWVPLYTIQYDGNGADNPNGMGTTDQNTNTKSVKQINVGEGDPVTLLASNFKRAGYGFAGWSTNPNATVISGDKIYGPMETINAPTYPNNGTNITTMYAVWVPAKTNNGNPIYLQNFTASDCNALTKTNFNASTGIITPGSVIALTDKRDNQVYTVARLADNNCWIVENLRLEHVGTIGNNINDNSVTNQSLSQGYGGLTGTYGNFVGLPDSESANFAGSAISNTIYKSSAASPIDTYDGNGTLEDIGSNNDPGLRFPRYNNDNTLNLIDSTTFTQNYFDASNPLDSETSYRESNLHSYGNYYTWAAAMANTRYYNTSSSEGANTSICPSNWHLPSSSDIYNSKEYSLLSQSYGGSGKSQSSAGTGDIISNRFRIFPNNFLLSGFFNNSSSYSRGNYGAYWSKTVVAAQISFNLNLYPASINPASYHTKHYGLSVRCLISP